MKGIAKKILPPSIVDLIRKILTGNSGFHGDFRTWEDAEAQCTGYDSQVIFEKVKQAALKVKNGEAVFERDSVLFDEIQYAWPCLTTLMYAAACFGGKLSVLDFGGSLGSSYFQNRKFFDGLDVEWSIVEQSQFVEFGKQEIADDRLRFYFTIEDCLQDRKPNVIFLSSVLQYLKDPYVWLEQFCSIDIPFIIIDRTPFSKLSQEIIQIQTVPKSIYKASYPLWVFNEEKWHDIIDNNGFKLIEAFNASSVPETDLILFKGLIISKTSSNYA